MDRQLAAILAADVAGYSRMMGVDEVGTLNEIRQFRLSVFEPLVARHRGNIVKHLGDGWLVTFSSAVDAVNCAITIQEKLAGHENLKLRIGVHIGDVVRQDEDVFGDSVNITARLEGIAEPGGVTISDHAYSSLDSTLYSAFQDGGERSLKNIARPVRVWERGALTAPQATTVDGAAAAPVALYVPQATCSESRVEVRELAGAITRETAAILGTIEWLEVGAESPGAHPLVLTLRARGDRLRLEAVLSNSKGGPVWSDRFDGELDDAFDWQDEAVEWLASAVRTRLQESERNRLSAIPREDLTAAQSYLLGVCHFDEFTADSLLAAIDMFILATEKEPDFGVAYARAAEANAIAVVNGWGERFTGGWERSRAWIKKAQELLPESGEVLAFATTIRLTAGEPTDLLRADFQRASWLSPNNAWVLTWAGWADMYGGDPTGAVEHLTKSIRLWPFDHSRVFAEAAMAMSMIQLKDYTAALRHAQTAIRFSTSFPGAWRAMLSAQGHLGDQEGAARTLEQLSRLVPGDSVSGVIERNPYADNANTNRYIEGLRLGGLPE